jgi:hypothetical protein
MNYVLVHPDFGVYVGNAFGLGFWSRLDWVGQETVTTFTTVEDAREHVKTWDANNDPDDYTCVACECQPDGYATKDQLLAAGVSKEMLTVIP